MFRSTLGLQMYSLSHVIDFSRMYCDYAANKNVENFLLATASERKFISSTERSEI